MSEGWGLKVKGKDMYMAAQQYGPPGSFTVSTKEGRPPIYSPKVFPTLEQAERMLERLNASDKDSGVGAFRNEWEIVDFSQEGKGA